MKIGVVGLGKLGLPLSLVFSKAGFKVYGVELDSKRILQIINNEHFDEPKVNEYIEKYGANLTVSRDYAPLEKCEVVFILTQTPSLPDGKFDLQYVESAVEKIHEVNPECLVVVSSNIGIGAMDKLVEIHSRICYNPEFIAQGRIIHDFENPKFVVIGAYTKKDGEQVANIWRKIHDKPIYVLKPVEAEIIKLSGNVSFALGITFANIIGELCEIFGADSNKVLDIIYQDRRNYKAGLGFMGPCFPKDVKYLEAIAMEHSIQSAFEFASLLNYLNNYTVERQIAKIKAYNLRKVGILGISYKPNVPYIFESQPLEIAKRLVNEGYEVYIFDNLAQENAKQILREAHYCKSQDECVENSDIIFIGTSNYANLKTNKPIINPWK